MVSGENGYDARQTLKEQTKMKEFMLDYRPCVNYVIETLLLVNVSGRGKQLLCFMNN